MCIFEQCFGFRDGRERQLVLFEHCAQFGRTVAGQVRPQDRHHPFARQHAVVVGLQARIGQHAFETEGPAEDEPLFVADRCQENLLAVFHREHVVHAPGRDAAGHRVGRLAGGGELQHVLAHQEHVVLEQRGLHLAAFAREFTLAQRGHGADGTEHAAHDVVDAGAGAQRITGAPGHVSQAAHHLHHFVKGRAMVVGAGQEALVADVDQARVEFAQRLVIEAQLLHGAGLEVLADDVGRGDQAQRRLDATGLLEIECDAFLVAVEGRKESRPRPQQAARIVTVDGLDLDDFGTQVAQQHAAGRPHHHVGELDDTDAGVRQRRRRGDELRHGQLPEQTLSASRLRASCRTPFRRASPPAAARGQQTTGAGRCRSRYAWLRT